MSDDERFTNRRGRQVLTKEVLGSITLDDGPEEQVTTTHVAKAAKVREQRVGRARKWPKVLALVLLLVLVGVPLLVGEYLTADYNASSEDARKQIKTLAARSVQSQQRSTTLRSNDAKTVATTMTTLSDGMCKGGFFDNLASLYPRAKEALANCFATREKVSALTRALSLLQQELAYSEELGQILKPVTVVPDDEQFANLSAQQEHWKTVHDQLKQLATPTAFKPAHDKTVALAGEIAASWTALIGANSAQDVAAFRDSEEILAKQYEQFRLLTVEYVKVINDTQQQLSKNYAQLNA